MIDFCETYVNNSECVKKALGKDVKIIDNMFSKIIKIGYLHMTERGKKLWVSGHEQNPKMYPWSSQLAELYKKSNFKEIFSPSHLHIPFEDNNIPYLPPPKGSPPEHLRPTQNTTIKNQLREIKTVT